MSRRKNRQNSTARIFVAVLAALCVCGAAVLAWFGFGELRERQAGESYYASLSVKNDEDRQDDERIEAQQAVIAAVLRQRRVRETSPEEYADSQTGEASSQDAPEGTSAEADAAREGGADAEVTPSDGVQTAAEGASVAGGNQNPEAAQDAPELAVMDAGAAPVGNADAEGTPGDGGQTAVEGASVAGGNQNPEAAQDASELTTTDVDAAPEGDADADATQVGNADAEATLSDNANPEATPSDGGQTAAEGASVTTDNQAPEAARVAPEGTGAEAGTTPEGGMDGEPLEEEDFMSVLKELEIRPSSMDFAPVQETCPDVVGWLRIDDTIIDYPVVQGPDNEYYLHHLADKKPNSNGAIMMDIKNDPLWRDMITTLHGHHMRSGAMFGDLSDYGKEEYYLEHPVAWVFTPLGDFQAQIFAACVVDPVQFGYPAGVSEEDFDAMIEQLRQNTSFEAPVEVAYGDRLLVLSTCEYTFPNARFILVAKMVPWPEEEEDGKSE